MSEVKTEDVRKELKKQSVNIVIIDNEEEARTLIAKLKTVDVAINELLGDSRFFTTRHACVVLRINDIAYKIHFQCWKHRDKILAKIHEWSEQHPTGSIWTDTKGRKFRLKYFREKSVLPSFGTFRLGGAEDFLLLIKQEGFKDFIANSRMRKVKEDE